MARRKADDEVFCTSCGEAIKQEAEVCPHCGVKNKNHQRTPSTTESVTRSDDDIVPKLLSVLPWAVGSLLILAGLGTLIGGGNIVRALVGGIIVTATGAFCLPPIREQVEPITKSRGIELSRGIVIVIVLVGLVAGMTIAPTTAEEPTANSASNTAQSSADTSSDGPADSGSSSSELSSNSANPTFAIRIEYSGSWSGAASVSNSQGSTSESYSGTGSETIDITGNPSIISANAQKKDDSSETITIQILKNGDVVSEASTSSEYGVAQTSKRV